MSSASIKRKFTNPQIIIKPFTYKVESDNFAKKRLNTQQKSETKLKQDKEYELYSNLRDLRNNNQLLSAPDPKLPHQSKIRTINVVELKKSKNLKKLRDQQFQQKKKILLQENKQKLLYDLKNLEKISVSAFTDFQQQVNLYNKYYSNYVGNELKLKQTHQEDLRISHNYHYQQIKPRYTYKEILNYTNPTVDYNNETVQQLKQEINNYMMTEEQFEIKELTNLRQSVRKQELDENEFIFLSLVKENELGQMRYFLINFKYVINARDCTGQTALHWAAKRNFYDICQELLNQKCNISIRDCSGRSARDIAEKYQHYKIAKLIQAEEEQLIRECNQ